MLVCLLAVSAIAPATAVAEESGELIGKVTSASTHTGLAHVYVEAFYSEHAFYREETNSSGEYKMYIPAGEYSVEFVPKEASSGYAPQFYNDKPTFTSATKVKVEGGKKREGVDAELAAADSISGTVSSAASGEDVGDVEVTLYEAQPPNAMVQTATSDSVGSYELTGLAKGEYVLGFRAAENSGLNFAPQFYKAVAAFGEATRLDLGTGEQRQQIDARLLKGGSISGVVTDAATHQPLGEVEVFAIVAGYSGPVAVAITGANGEYLVPGMASGSVVLLFEPASKEGQHLYSAQIYNGHTVPESFTSFGELAILGNPVAVTAGLDTAGIDVALVRHEPANTVAPVASGTPALGQTLSCAVGQWTGVAPIAYAYQWLRDGAAIAGANASSYAVQAADVGHALACQVKASNEFGSAGAVSNTLAVPAPAAPKPTVTIAAADVTVVKGEARVPLACARAACAGTVELTEQQLVLVRRHGHITHFHRTVVLAHGAYTIAAGDRATISLRLSSACARALAAARRHRLSAVALATVRGGADVKRAVTLIQQPASKRR